MCPKQILVEQQTTGECQIKTSKFPTEKKKKQEVEQHAEIKEEHHDMQEVGHMAEIRPPSQLDPL